MELIMINSSKLKIMLTGDDMKKYDLDTDAVNYNTTATRRAFWSILDDAKNQTGFDAATDNLFIQLYPSKAGGCEMYVTKMDTVPTCEKSSRPKGSLQIVPTDRQYGGRLHTNAYVFQHLESLLCVCRRLLALGFDGESAAYRDQEGGFFLLLRKRGYGTYVPLDEFSFISEYGRSENVERIKLYISEHATCICEKNAVKQLGIL